MYSIPYSRTCVFVVCATHTHARTHTPQERSPLAVRMPVTVSHVRSFGRSSHSSCLPLLVSIVVGKDVPSCNREKYRRNHVSRHCQRPLADDDCRRTADRRRPSRQSSFACRKAIDRQPDESVERERYVYRHMTCRIGVDLLNFILSTVKQIKYLQTLYEDLNFILFFVEGVFPYFQIGTPWTPKKPLRE